MPNILALDIEEIIKAAISSLNAKAVIIETSQLICRATQLTGFYMMATLAFNELTIKVSDMNKISTIKVCQNL